MSRELENQIKRAKNMLEYYNEKLSNDEKSLKNAKSPRTLVLIKLICSLLASILDFALIVVGLSTGNISPSLIATVLFAVSLDRLLTSSKEYKKINEDYLSFKQNIIQDNELIKTYEEKLTKALSKLNELQHENTLENNFTLDIEGNLSMPLSRKRVLK